MTDKVQTLIGFAIKAGKTVFGSEQIECYRKKKYLLVLCRTLSEGSVKKLAGAARGIKVIMTTQKTLGEITHREGVKAMLITDKQMADAIVANINEGYRFVTEVN